MQKHQNLILEIEAVLARQQIFHQNNKHRFEVNRICSCCKRQVKTDDVTFIGESGLGVWFNHNYCGSTMLQPIKIRFKGPQIALNSFSKVVHNIRKDRNE